MNTLINRRERIKLIHRINDIVSMYQGRCLTSEDFNMLYELDIDQLLDVEREMINQARELDKVNH